MKKILLPMLALSATFASYANPYGSNNNTEKKTQKPTTEKVSVCAKPISGAATAAVLTTSASKTASTHLINLSDANEDLNSLFKYSELMGTMLNQIKIEKHLDAAEDLKAEDSYNRLMVRMLMYK